MKYRFSLVKPLSQVLRITIDKIFLSIEFYTRFVIECIFITATRYYARDEAVKRRRRADNVYERNI